MAKNPLKLLKVFHLGLAALFTHIIWIGSLSSLKFQLQCTRELGFNFYGIELHSALQILDPSSNLNLDSTEACRGNSMSNLRTAFGCCPLQFAFSKNCSIKSIVRWKYGLFKSNMFFLEVFIVKSALLHLSRTLPSVSRTTPGTVINSTLSSTV